MKVSKWIVIVLLTGLILSLLITSVSAQSITRDPALGLGGIVIVTPPAHKKSDCNHNGIEDLDEFWLPDCWKAPSSGSG
ncbi:MAG: hypothetical protein K8I30_22700 [Anaerolineae bacterium]|nr:hypothetical protein [Anaerolineae bacterium]